MRSREYVLTLKRTMDDLCAQSEQFRAGSKLIVDSAVDGGHLYLHDPSSVITYEAAGRAAGLYMVRLLRAADVPSLRQSTKDVVIVFSNRNHVADELEFLKQIRKKGARIVGVLPLHQEYKSPSLADIADVVIDNGLTHVGGLLSFGGFAEKIGSPENVVNCTVIFALCAEVIGEFISRGLKPSVYMSLRAQGSREYDERIWEQYRRQGF
jgi:uncharacterized phosphosugar-binding protein